MAGINFCDDNPMDQQDLNSMFYNDLDEDELDENEAGNLTEKVATLHSFIQAEVIADLEDQLRQVKADYGQRYAEVLDHVMNLSIQADERDAEIFRLEAEVATLRSFLPAEVRTFLALAKANAAANDETDKLTLPPSYDRD